jgi:hypothetical protein
MTKPLITAETEIGKKKTRGVDLANWDSDRLESAILALPLFSRAELAKAIKKSITEENEQRTLALKESEDILKEL